MVRECLDSLLGVRLDTTGRDHKGLRTERNRGNREVDNWTALALNNIGPDILDGNVRNRRHRTARRRLQGASFDIDHTVRTCLERSVFMGEGVDDNIRSRRRAPL